MRNIFILAFLFLNTLSGYADEIDSVIELIIKQMIVNDSLSKQGNIKDQRFLTYFNPFYPQVSINNIYSTVAPIPHVSDYIIEDPENIFPNFSKYEELLETFNNEISHITNTKVPHYVCIVDIAPAIFGKYVEYNGFSDYFIDYFKEDKAGQLSYDEVYKLKLNEKINNLKNGSGKIFNIDFNNNYFVSIFVLNRKIKPRGYSISLEPRNIYTENQDMKTGVAKFYLNLDMIKVVTSKIKYIQDYITIFAQTFHNGVPNMVECSPNMGEQINIETPQGQEFLDFFCENYPDWISIPGKSYVVYNSAKFIDIMNILYTTIGAQQGSPVDPNIWKIKIQNLVSEYFDSFNENSEYGILAIR
ncbi:MAG: hypothetical protein R2771_02405 [Saprospiraceae bacterium]